MATAYPAGSPAARSTTIKANKKILTREDHALIQQKCNINAESGEDYAAVLMRGKGFAQWSFHVFTRQPTQREMDAFEQTASKVKFKGAKAQIEGSQITAAVTLYNALISRAYDVLVSLKSYDQLPADQARALVPPLVKRAAINELVNEVYAESRLREAEGGDEDEGDDDNPEAHISGGPEDSEL